LTTKEEEEGSVFLLFVLRGVDFWFNQFFCYWCSDRSSTINEITHSLQNKNNSKKTRVEIVKRYIKQIVGRE
jgi:DUF1365 family protein